VPVLWRRKYAAFERLFGRKSEKVRIEIILLTDDAERTIYRLKRNYGNAEVIFHHLEALAEDIRAFDIVGNSKSFLEFYNLLENDGCLLSHSAILKKLVNKLPETT
jgi:GR25 family glycosyltransferase involved in LPS biosynthesis